MNKMSPATADHLTNDVLDLLYSDYTLENGTVVQGQPVSFVVSCLRDRCRSGRSWKISAGHGFENTLEDLGFKIEEARSVRRNQRALIVTV